MARLTFLGAVEGVTGSQYLLETARSRILLDCGLFQGRKEEEAGNEAPFEFDPQALDAVVLSHAHLDHSGRLPLLARGGFGGPVYMTRPTADLIEVLLHDAASLQERDVEWANRRRRRAGKPELAPLYTNEDVDLALELCVGLPYHAATAITEDVTLTFHDAGHILGSAIVQLVIHEDGRDKTLVFSGDLGNAQAALLRDPEYLQQADILLMESTYGDRNHKPMDETLQEFENVIEEASANGGNILIPSFAVGRTQELIYRLGELYQKGKLRHQAIYLDSPMAIAVTEIYHRYQYMYNHEDRAEIEHHTRKLKPAQRNLHSFLPILRYSITPEDSMALNKIDRGAIIIAGSGMCNGGRIRHHLKHNLWRRQSHVLFVGYQAIGTPGRALVDGATHLHVAGEDVVVNARIHTLGGFSAHAGQTQLLEWLNHFRTSRPELYLVHGEPEAKQALKRAAEDDGWQAHIPDKGTRLTF
ncbi:MAG: MBL fold metallo-hydrolase [Gammaproteobacteria bacterium]|nr:MAG: MBL fold metallo-hydrolase [Gammaproteobacteria bacterium]